VEDALCELSAAKKIFGGYSLSYRLNRMDLRDEQMVSMNQAHTPALCVPVTGAALSSSFGYCDQIENFDRIGQPVIAIF
jgi:hypothetical protein